ncbi:MAG: hypothetical protein GY835_01980 [bacterium]|nr:hypothetical protein [bacterium]
MSTLFLLALFLLASETTLAQDGFPGHNLLFDGIAGQRVVCGESGSTGISDAMTIEAWVWVGSGVPDETFVGMILARYFETPPSQISFHIGTNGRLRFTVVPDSSPIFLGATGTDLRDNSWHHVAGSYSTASGETRLYIDGHLMDSEMALEPLDLDWPLCIGNHLHTQERPFLGHIEEVRLWNVERSAQEIRENMHLTLTGGETGLISYWQFNEGGGLVAADVVGGHDGVLTNMQGDEWYPSTAVVGAGESATWIVDATGVFDFSPASLSMDFTTKTGVDTVVATRIDLAPNLAQIHEPLDGQHWVVEKYGSGSFTVDLEFTLSEDIGAEEEVEPSRLRLYERPANSTGYWSHLGPAVAADAGGDAATFAGLSGFGQFLVGRAAFTEIPTPMLGVKQCSAAWGDYDNDGDLDVLLTGFAVPPIFRVTRIYRNDDGTFVDIEADLIGVNNSSVAWGDYDNDGDLDILLHGYSSDFGFITRIYRNDAGVFTDIEAGLPVHATSSQAWGDYDNDGDLDILEARPSIGSSIYENDDGVFSDISAGLQSGNVGVWGDYDNDGDLDILLAGPSLIYQNVAGSFSIAASGLAHANSGAWGDYDNDGDLDILLTQDSSSTIYENDAGIFSDVSAGLRGGYEADWSDYDNDGDLDILVVGDWTPPSYVSRVYRNDSGVFVDIQADLGGGWTGEGDWGDYDGDGDLDCLIIGDDVDGNGLFSLLRNNSLVANTPPAAPVGLAADVDGDRLRLQWSAAGDGETPSPGLNYSLRVGSTPGGAEIMRPHALADGTPTVPALGTVNDPFGWWLPDPGFGTWYFSVQALDAAFAGSPFATELAYSTFADFISIEDVPADQGGNLRLTWHRSAFDEPGTDIAVTGYAIFRRQDGRVDDGTREAGSHVAPAAHKGEEYFRMEGWDFLAWVPTFGDEVYQYVTPTFCDSTAEDSMCWSAYMIRTATSDPFVFADCPPDSGYSVDNLAPPMPSGFVFATEDMLGWEVCLATDFSYFSVYGSDWADLGEASILIGHTTTLEMDVAAHHHAYFHLTATDFSGNESDAAVLQSPTAVPPALPAAFVLHANVPNPFNPKTTIRFDLPESAVVDLRIFDLSGRLIRTLRGGEVLPGGAHEVDWHGRGDAGNRVASGVYLCRLEAGEFSATQRMTLLK